MKNDPPVIGGVICSLESVEFDGVDEGAPICFVALRTHAICYYNVLETAFVADIIVLRNSLVASRCIELMHIHSANLFPER